MSIENAGIKKYAVFSLTHSVFSFSAYMQMSDQTFGVGTFFAGVAGGLLGGYYFARYLYGKEEQSAKFQRQYLCRRLARLTLNCTSKDQHTEDREKDLSIGHRDSAKQSAAPPPDSDTKYNTTNANAADPTEVRSQPIVRSTSPGRARSDTETDLEAKKVDEDWSAKVMPTMMQIFESGNDVTLDLVFPKKHNFKQFLKKITEFWTERNGAAINRANPFDRLPALCIRVFWNGTTSLQIWTV